MGKLGQKPVPDQLCTSLLSIIVAKYVLISAENYVSRSERADRVFWSIRELSQRFRDISL